MGSPPRVWGNFLCPGLKACFQRFTPTCVGKLLDASVRQILGYGSPPRVWGNFRRSVNYSLSNQVHPHVCGETSVRAIRPLPLSAVHPHVCGETFFSPVTSNVASGSPPRVWGNFHLRALARPSGRFTPTCVGKLEGATLGSELLSVHPHVCGETATTTAKKSSSAGSPPRVWGNYHILA